jgi:hypothetical protein
LSGLQMSFCPPQRKFRLPHYLLGRLAKDFHLQEAEFDSTQRAKIQSKSPRRLR